MDNVINKIIDIDRKALTIKEKMKEMVENNEIRLKRQLEELENRALIDGRNQGRKEYERLIAEGKEEEKKINLETERECEALEQLFLKVHEALEKSIFDEIF